MARWNSISAAVVVVVLASALAPESSNAGFFSYGWWSYDYGSYTWPYWSPEDFSWLVVDAFTAPQPSLQIYSSAQLSSISTDSSILGGERDVSLIGTYVNGQAQPRYAQVETTQDSWSSYGWGSDTANECLEYFSGSSRDTTYPATVVVQWDGTDGVTQLDTSGLDHIDLTAQGAYAFVLAGQGLYTDHFIDAEIRVYSYGSAAQNFCSCPISFVAGPDATYSLYSSCEMVNDGCNMQSVGALEFWVENTYASFEMCQLGTYAGTDATPLPSPSATRSPSKSSSPTRSMTPSRTPSPVPLLAPSQNVTVDGQAQFQTGFVSTSGYSSMTFAASPANSPSYMPPVCMYTSYETKPSPTSFDYSACAGTGQVAEITYSGSDLLDGWYYGLLTSNDTTHVMLQWQLE